MISRTPRNFDGINLPGLKTNDILIEILRDIRRLSTNSSQEIFSEWSRLLGEKMALLAQPISFLDGVLTVIVKSSTLYSLLCQYEKPRLLRSLQNVFQIKNIVFKIG